ncbi:MAG: hypothetical protein PHH13_05710, partial [Candidatus Peribacteraceae bacterium]|nr:hypothetical protein [Candidatus Peribacteraceae bacterium]
DPKHYPVSDGRAPILEILFDTAGAKAAYGNEIPQDTTTEWYGSISSKILDAWHCGEGNNVRAALETAVSFLPQQ